MNREAYEAEIREQELLANEAAGGEAEAMSMNKEPTQEQDEKRIAELPCQNCGRLVTVILPFVGCVFCADCAKGDSSGDASSEQIQRRWIYS